MLLRDMAGLGLIPHAPPGEEGPALPLNLHIPKTEEPGIFKGKYSGYGETFVQAFVQDDGELTGLLGEPAINLDQRVLRVFDKEVDEAEEYPPSALGLEYSAPRRAERWPYDSEVVDGIVRRYTYWGYSGEEEDVVERPLFYDYTRHWDTVQFYDGRADLREDYPTTQRSIRTFDFQWKRTLPPSSSTLRGRIYLTEERTFRPVLSPGVEGTPGGFYRNVEIQTQRFFDQANAPLLVDTLIQMHHGSVTLPGWHVVGQSLRETDRQVEVTKVHSRYASESQAGAYFSVVDAWMTIASVRQQTGGAMRTERELVATRSSTPGSTPGENPGDSYTIPGGWIKRSVGDPGLTLRDTITEPWPPPPEPNDHLFDADSGRVTVRGRRRRDPQMLEDRDQEPNAVLTAYGSSFTGGSWAALRDAPLYSEKPGGPTDWSRVVVLHASETTVTAVRSSGEILAMPRSTFEIEVLRVRPGEFRGFSPVGMLSNTWPPQWAFCICDENTRAIVAHEAWRDSVKTPLKPGENPPPPTDPPRLPSPGELGPEHWYWPQRPGKRPPMPPQPQPTAPVSPLRLTLADVLGAVLHDELLGREEGPLLLPVAAVVGGQDVLAAIAKRILYPPAKWPEELDDGRSTGGPLKLTFELNLNPRPPSGDFLGEAVAAALVLRLKTRGDSIVVNGSTLPLIKLGHNAEEERGWHPYVVSVRPSRTYTLQFEGKCSRALLCARVVPILRFIPPQED